LFQALALMHNLPPELIEQAKQLGMRRPEELGFNIRQQQDPTQGIPPQWRASGKQDGPNDDPFATLRATPNGLPPDSRGPVQPRNSSPPREPTLRNSTPGKSGKQPSSSPRSATTPGTTPPGSPNSKQPSTKQPDPSSPRAKKSPGTTPPNPQPPPQQPTPNSSPRRPTPRETRQAAPQQTSPDEGFRERMNRILLNAARNANRNVKHGDPNALERLVAMAQKSVQKSINETSPEMRRKLRDSMSRIDRRTRERNAGGHSTSWLNQAQPPSPPAGGDFPWQTAGIWLAVGLGIGALATVWVRRQQHPARRQAVQHAIAGKRLQWLIQAIRNRTDLIAAFDQFVLWSRGAQAASWNTRDVRESLVRDTPERREEIAALVETYASARYAPEHLAISTDHLDHGAALLHELAGGKSRPDFSSASTPANAVATVEGKDE
ncbi:MAG: hypothetical protein KDA47_16930, partial [Planctomycetales bacterium]|nr:hypothetical protein [Planctomycetales bacterium]